MYIDTHVHSAYSLDCAATVEEQLERAIRRGMPSLCITDHQDYDAPQWRGMDMLLSGTGDIPDYLEGLQRVKAAYADRIELLIGIEYSLQPHLVERHNREYAQYPFDMVIGSTHAFEGRDTEDMTLYEGRPREAAIRSYFETELENVALTDGYDTVGHLDFVLRDIPGKNEGFTYRQYADVLDELLKTAIRKDKAIELNSKSLAIGLRDSGPGREVFRRYRELGGELVTLGSDAHFPERIGACFDVAGEILKDAGFKYYCIYRGHQPELLPL